MVQVTIHLEMVQGTIHLEMVNRANRTTMVRGTRARSRPRTVTLKKLNWPTTLKWPKPWAKVYHRSLKKNPKSGTTRHRHTRRRRMNLQSWFMRANFRTSIFHHHSWTVPRLPMRPTAMTRLISSCAPVSPLCLIHKRLSRR